MASILDLLRWLFRARPAEPDVAEPGVAAIRPALPETDSWEDWSGDAERLPFQGTFSFAYVDRRDQPSHRTVDALELIREPGDVLLRGFCHARQANRTFALSRMSDLVDLSTGEVIAHPTTALLERWQQTPVGHAHAVVNAHPAEIALLLFVARATGRLSVKATPIIIEWLAASARDAVDRGELARLVRQRQDTTQAGFRRSLRAIKRKPPEARELLRQSIDALDAAMKTKDDVARAIVAQARKATE